MCMLSSIKIIQEWLYTLTTDSTLVSIFAKSISEEDVEDFDGRFSRRCRQKFNYLCIEKEIFFDSENIRLHTLKKA